MGRIQELKGCGGGRQEGRLTPWSLSQDGGAVPGPGSSGTHRFRWIWDECLFPLHEVRE